MRPRQLFSTTVIALGALSGCAGISGFPAFDRPATEADVLTSDFDSLDDGQLDGFDLDSVRYVTTHDGEAVYLIKDDLGTPCIAVGHDGSAFTSCGAGGRISLSGLGIATYELGPEPMAEGEGWTVLSENVRVQD